MHVYAHRGAARERPENTLGAFRRALEVGAFGIELDVHLSKDGVAVVIHDDTVDRTTNGSGAVAELTLAELNELEGAAGERIPTLEDVLDLVGTRCAADIEVKAAAAARVVLREAGRRNGLRWAMSSFDHDVLRFARSMSSAVELWPLVTRVDSAVLATVRELRSSVLALNDRSVTQPTVDELKAEGIGIWAWTVNDPDRARTLASWNVDGICTDDPGAIARAIGID